MRKITVQVFAADPLSAGAGGSAPRLMLDEEVRRMREMVRAADLRHAVEFDVRLAARPRDLLQAMNEVAAEVVHFSGHGGSRGLVLAGEDGRAHPVDADGLARLFSAFRGTARVVVLNACLSLPQARAIAEVMGCAIGTRSEISDGAAVTFAGAFYSAIAFGCSVGDAFEQARAALGLQHPAEAGCPQLVARPGMDPFALVLVPREASPRPPRPRRTLPRAIAVLALAAGTVAYLETSGEARLPPAATRPMRDGADAVQTARRAADAPVSPPPPAGSGKDAASPAGSRGAGGAARPSPAERGGRGSPPRPPAPRDPDPAALAFAHQALSEGRREFARGEYLPARQRLAAALPRLEALDRQFPDSQPLRTLQKQIAATLAEVRTACEADAQIRKEAAQCT